MANSLAQYLADLQVQIKEAESRLVFGVVISTSPLRVKYGEITLEDDFLFVEDGVTLTVGQKVPMLKTNRSQLFIVMLSKDGNTNNPYLYKSATTTINTFENGWEGSLTLSRYGDLVSIKGVFSKTGTVVTNGTQITAIPVDFRPYTTTPIAVSKGNTSPYDSSFLFWLSTGGVLQIRTSDTIPADQSDASLCINQIYSV